MNFQWTNTEIGHICTWEQLIPAKSHWTICIWELTAHPARRRPGRSAVRGRVLLLAHYNSLKQHSGLIWAWRDLRQNGWFEKRSRPFTDVSSLSPPQTPPPFVAPLLLISQTMKKILCWQGCFPAESKPLSSVCLCLPVPPLTVMMWIIKMHNNRELELN